MTHQNIILQSSKTCMEIYVRVGKAVIDFEMSRKSHECSTIEGYDDPAAWDAFRPINPVLLKVIIRDMADYYFRSIQTIIYTHTSSSTIDTVHSFAIIINAIDHAVFERLPYQIAVGLPDGVGCIEKYNSNNVLNAMIKLMVLNNAADVSINQVSESIRYALVMDGIASRTEMGLPCATKPAQPQPQP